MREYVEKNQRKVAIEDHFKLQYGSDVFKNEREKLKRFKSSLGLGDSVPNGTAMYFYLCKAVKDIKEREKRERKLKKMMD